MNFLAHIYLSGENKMIQIGNFMADSVKGNNYLNYTTNLQKGILLHRAIDSFTDAHPTYRQSKHRLHENFGHYSGVIMDVIYDHFLARNWTRFSTESLTSFVQNFYYNIDKNIHLLPLKTQHLVPYMIKQNWLESYAELDGLKHILWQMSHRIKFRVNMSLAVIELQNYYTETQTEFFSFMVALEQMCQEKIEELGKQFN